MSRPTISRRQQAILDAVLESLDRRGYPPSVRELCKASGLTSSSSVHHQLIQLEMKGYLRRDVTVSRGLQVLLPPAGAA